MKIIISILIFLFMAVPAYADDWTNEDTMLFTSVCVFQIVDGLTTMSHLENNDLNYISNTWNWKYGCKRPSAGQMWGVKAVELVGAYYVGKTLPTKWRKVFFIGADCVLVYCIQNNLRAGAGFSITF